MGMRTLFIIFLGLIGVGLVLYLLSRFREVWRDRRAGGREEAARDHLDRPVRFGHDGDAGGGRPAPKADS
ncbi:MAG: hypothetical protein ACM3N5_07975 [Candidatus Eiseniibacteriota bacterium]